MGHAGIVVQIEQAACGLGRCTPRERARLLEALWHAAVCEHVDQLTIRIQLVVEAGSVRISCRNLPSVAADAALRCARARADGDAATFRRHAFRHALGTTRKT